MTVRVVALSEVAEVKRGTTITQKQTRPGHVPVVAGGMDMAYFHDTANRDGNVITISGSGANAGFVNFWEQPIFASDCSTVEPKADDLNVRYAFFFLKSKQDQINSLRSGAAQPHVYPRDLMQLQIPLPPLAEQRRLVDLLSRAEGIVRLRREAQAKAAEIIPTLFLDMFGDPASNPKGWPLVPIGELVDRFEGGKNVQAGDEETALYRILKISAVTSGTYIETESKPAPTDFEPPESYFVKSGDLLFSRANTETLVGAVALVDQTDGKALLPDKLWRFVWRDETSILPSFALSLFQQSSIRLMLSSIASGTGGSMKNISQAKLKTLRLPIPPVELQRKFAAKVEILRAVGAQQINALATSQATFDALLYQAFAAD